MRTRPNLLSFRSTSPTLSRRWLLGMHGTMETSVRTRTRLTLCCRHLLDMNGKSCPNGFVSVTMEANEAPAAPIGQEFSDPLELAHDNVLQDGPAPVYGLHSSAFPVTLEGIESLVETKIEDQLARGLPPVIDKMLSVLTRMSEAYIDRSLEPNAPAVQCANSLSPSTSSQMVGTPPSGLASTSRAKTPYPTCMSPLPCPRPLSRDEDQVKGDTAAVDFIDHLANLAEP
mmetsp:Transcript_50320/g.93032  ORF Transcript_50320/g.93032 Transcript_50320/m.93032 type:complete len:229 (-) Transcript_50320:73-759(-)